MLIQVLWDHQSKLTNITLTFQNIPGGGVIRPLPRYRGVENSTETQPRVKKLCHASGPVYIWRTLYRRKVEYQLNPVL